MLYCVSQTIELGMAKKTNPPGYRTEPNRLEQFRGGFFKDGSVSDLKKKTVPGSVSIFIL